MSRDIEVVHAEVRAAYTSPYGFVSKYLVPSNGWELKLLRGQFLEVRRPGWAGAVLIPYENLRGLTTAPDREGADHKKQKVNAAGRVTHDAKGRPIAPKSEPKMEGSIGDLADEVLKSTGGALKGKAK